MSEAKSPRIVPYRQDYKEAVVGMTLRAWTPVFERMKSEFPSYVFAAFWPQGWEERQEREVVAMCEDMETAVHVALVGDTVAGFVGIRIHPEDRMGEIYIVGVAPEFQRQGIGGELIDFALGEMRKADCEIAMVETSSDEGHGPARESYEAVGFELWPVARYFKRL